MSKAELKKINKPGWYWITWKGDPHRPELFHVTEHQGCFYTHTIHQFLVMGENLENWYRAKDVDTVEFIGNELLAPKKSGYYWITAAKGEHYIVQVVIYPDRPERDRVHVWLVGKPCQYGWLAVYNAYRPTSLDYIGRAQDDYYSQRM